MTSSVLVIYHDVISTCQVILRWELANNSFECLDLKKSIFELEI